MKPVEGSEHALWQYIRIGIQHAGHLVRIETREQGVGTPDINYCLRGVEGHLELKYWHRKSGFELRATQHRWFQRREEAGGNSWVLAEYKNDETHWFALINGCKSRQMATTSSAAEWLRMAAHVWVNRVDFDELIEFLTNQKVIYVRERVIQQGEETQRGQAAPVEAAGVQGSA